MKLFTSVETLLVHLSNDTVWGHKSNTLKNIWSIAALVLFWLCIACLTSNVASLFMLFRSIDPTDFILWKNFPCIRNQREIVMTADMIKCCKTRTWISLKTFPELFIFLLQFCSLIAISVIDFLLICIIRQPHVYALSLQYSILCNKLHKCNINSCAKISGTYCCQPDTIVKIQCLFSRLNSYIQSLTKQLILRFHFIKATLSDKLFAAWEVWECQTQFGRLFHSYPSVFNNLSVRYQALCKCFLSVLK